MPVHRSFAIVADAYIILELFGTTVNADIVLLVGSPPFCKLFVPVCIGVGAEIAQPEVAPAGAGNLFRGGCGRIGQMFFYFLDGIVRKNSPSSRIDSSFVHNSGKFEGVGGYGPVDRLRERDIVG